MAIKFNGSAISDVKVCRNGSLVDVTKIMKDGATLWEKDSADYLTLTAQSAGSTVTFGYYSGSNVEYRVNGGAWISCPDETTVTLDNVGDKVQYRGNNVVTTYVSSSPDSKHFSMTGSIAASGSVTSLIDGVGTNPNVTLPESCCLSMFDGCSSLTSAPKIPALTLSESCYKYMFYGCTGLTSVPNFNATTLAEYCYYEMFCGCTNLTGVPVFPESVLASDCYEYMFSNCSGITKVILNNFDYNKSIHGSFASDHTVTEEYNIFNVEYIESNNGEAYTAIPFSIYNTSNYDVCEFSIELPVGDNVDRKVLGQFFGSGLGVSTYASGWRFFFNDNWYNDLISSMRVSDYPRLTCRSVYDPSGSDTGVTLTFRSVIGGTEIRSINKRHHVESGVSDIYSFGIGCASEDNQVYPNITPNGTKPLTVRFRYFKRWINGDLVLDLIPKKLGTVGFVYDAVNDYYYLSVTSTPFTAGPIVS